MITAAAAFAVIISLGGWLAIRLSEESERQDHIFATILTAQLDETGCDCAVNDA